MNDGENRATQVGVRKGNRVKVSKWEGHPTFKWRASYIENGKYKSKGFKTKAKAEKWAEEREAEALIHGTGDSLTAAERAAVIETRESLAELGVSVREALNHALDHFRQVRKSVTVEELIDKFIDAKRKAGRSNRYLQDLDSRLGRFKKHFGDRIVATISGDEIEDWLHELKLAPVTTNNFRRVLIVAFNYAISKKYCEGNPAEETEKSKEIESDVEILTPEETNRLLIAADERILPAIAIGAFAGLRSSELERLDWSDINLKEGQLRVRAVSAKSSRNRLVPIADCLKSWLTPHAREKGRVWPTNGRKIIEASRRSAGFGNPKDADENETVQPWLHNALRHSFASYHLAFHKHAGDLALQLGHTNTKIIFQHYRGIVTEKEAKAYWSITPQDKQSKLTVALD